MSENIKGGAALFLKIVVVMIMTFFLSMSTSILCVAGFTDVIGYTVYGAKEGDEKATVLYTYYYADGEDTKAEQFADEGYKVTNTLKIRSELKDTGKIVYTVGTQSIIVIILFAFIYSQLWKKGNKDFQKVKLGRLTEDKLRGLKIGLIASVPQLVSFLCLFIPKFKTAFYKIANYHFFITNDAIIGDVKLAGDLQIYKYLLLLLPLLVVPVLSTLSYIIGYKDINISEKIIYKKNEI